jgi:nucleoid DNA-binding protein
MGSEKMFEVVRKSALDGKVAELLGMKTREVSVITAAFLNEARRALARTWGVRLDGLGRLYIGGRRGPGPDGVQVMKYRVSFKKSQTLNAAMKAARGGMARKKEKVMEKYGVDETADENLEKQATDGCPVCGGKVERHGKVLTCAAHGTEPWEPPAGTSKR